MNKPNENKEQGNVGLRMKVFDGAKSSINDLTQASSSYVWLRRIKEIFLVIGKDESDPFAIFDKEIARKDMIEACEKYIQSAKPTLSNIDEELTKEEQEELREVDRQKRQIWNVQKLYAETFKMSYCKDTRANPLTERKDEALSKFSSDPDDIKMNKVSSNSTQSENARGEDPHFDNAIWWYSCNEAFIFSQINNILRLENFELLITYRYYIVRLCQMIEELYIKNKPRQKRQIVYRADKIKQSDFDAMKQSSKEKDQLISINGFISTTTDKKIAEFYAKKPSNGVDFVPVLYEITIDPLIPCQAFADIETISFHPEEKELLFSIGSTFSVDSVAKNDNENFHRIKLTARNMRAPVLDDMKLKVKKSSQSSLTILLIKYLIELGEHRAARRYLKSILDSVALENDPSLASAYNCLALIYSKEGIHSAALEYYKKALNTQARLEYSNNNALAEIYNNIGYTYIGLRNIDVAIQNLNEAERIQLREPELTREHLASIYCNIGQAYFIKNDHSKSKEYFEKSFDIYKEDTTKKIRHDALENSLMKADLCIQYGHLLSKLDDNFADATEKYNMALKIYENTLILEHPKLMKTHIDIFSAYAKHKAYSAVTEKYENKEFKVLIEKYTGSQQTLANLYFIIGACYIHQGKYDDGMNVWNNAILYEKKQYLDENLPLTTTDGTIQVINSAYRKAFIYYSNESNSDSFNLGIITSKLFNYDKAIKHLKASESATIDKSIIRSILLGDMYFDKELFKSAIIEYNNACDQIGTKENYYFLKIAINLLIIQSLDDNNEKLDELIKIKDSLLNNDDIDYNTTSMKTIIYYKIAQLYLRLEKYDDARLYAYESVKLKINHFSHRHLNLVKDYLLIANSYFNEKNYSESLQLYEHIIEIQIVNLPPDHTDIRMSYYKIGDVYCKMEKLDQAIEKYKIARSNNPHYYLPMHINLIELYHKQKWYSKAHEEEEIETLNILREQLPKDIVNMAEEDNSNLSLPAFQTLFTNRINIISGKMFATFLQDLISIYLTIGDIYVKKQSIDDDDDIRQNELRECIIMYKKAINLLLKISMYHDNKLTVLIYEKLGNIYELNNNLENAIKNYQNALAIETEKYALHHKLVSFSYIDKKYESLRKYMSYFWYTTGTVSKQAFARIWHYNNSTSNDEFFKGLIDDGVRTYFSLAQTYSELNDYENALKYFKKNVEFSSTDVTLSSLNIPKEINSKMAKYIPDLIIEKLNKIKTISTHVLDDNNNNKIESYIKCGEISMIKNKYGDAIEYYLNAFYLCVTKLNNAEILTDKEFIDEICQKLKQDSLEQKDIITYYSNISNQDAIMINVKMGALNRNNGDDKDAIKNYADALQLLDGGTSNQIIEAAINYILLKLYLGDSESNRKSSSLSITNDLSFYQSFLPFSSISNGVDDEHIKKYRTEMIENMRIDKHKIPVPDRVLICRLIINNVEDEISKKKYKDLLYQIYLEKEDKDSYAQPSSDSLTCIGHVLTKADDYKAAILYWNEIREFKEQMLPTTIMDMIHSPKSTFIQIYNETKLLNKNLSKYILSIADYSRKLGDYYVKLNNREEADDAMFFTCRRRAIECYQNASRYYDCELNSLMKREDDERHDRNIHRKNIEHINKKMCEDFINYSVKRGDKYKLLASDAEKDKILFYYQRAIQCYQFARDDYKRLIKIDEIYSKQIEEINIYIQDTLEKIANHLVEQGNTLANDKNSEEDNQLAIQYYEDAKFNYNYALEILIKEEEGRDKINKFYRHNIEHINKNIKRMTNRALADLTRTIYAENLEESVSKYDENFYCIIEKVIITPNTIRVYIDERGNSSYGLIQHPNTSRLVLVNESSTNIDLTYLDCHFTIADPARRYLGYLKYKTDFVYNDSILQFYFSYGGAGYTTARLFSLNKTLIKALNFHPLINIWRKPIEIREKQGNLEIYRKT